MKILAIAAILLTTFSTLASAQQLSTGNIVGQISTIERTANDFIKPLERPTVLAPFSLSSLPDINSINTAPLNALPTSLVITNNAGESLWLDVEVENGWRAVKGQWLLLANELSKQRLIEHGAIIISESQYPALDLALLRFNVPEALDSKQALTNLLTVKEAVSLARNHIYQAQHKATDMVEDSANKIVANKANDKNEKSMLRSGTSSVCDLDVKVGLVDSAIDSNHNALKQADITAKSFLPDTINQSSQHGTAIASVLVGKREALMPLLPQAKVYAAQVFYQQSDYAQGATLSAIITGVNWLLEQNVKVINMSLAGPDNKILQRVLTAAMAKGAWVVAAAGNEGPAAPAMYPAAYQDVIAVSAIDKMQQPYRWSNRGDYIDYAALGVNVLTAQSGHRIGRESGTSIAAPHITAHIACLTAVYGEDKQVVLTQLNKLAVDLGPKGKDPIYGVGAILRP
jgi:minor extracellular protease Epr